MEARIARLESDVAHLRTDVADIKIDVRSLRDKLDAMTKRFDHKFDASRLHVAMTITCARPTATRALAGRSRLTAIAPMRFVPYTRQSTRFGV